MIPSQYPLSDPAPSDLEADALLALGRLGGALEAAGATTLRLFATRLLRDLLMTALRQEGHMFTDQRFHAWFAGLAALSDHPPRSGRPPRALCEAILTELTHSRWSLLAGLAARFHVALLAPGDHFASDLAAETAHQEALAVVAAARALLGEVAPSPHPLTALANLHCGVEAHVLFAPPERASETIVMGPIRLKVERAAAPSPRWALEMLWGEHWQAAGLLQHALPFPSLIRLDALRAGKPAYPDDPDDTPTILAAALRDVAQALCGKLKEADRLAGHLKTAAPGKRRTSRAPALLELLVGFGPLRSAQLEVLLGITRIGLRTMLDAPGTAGLLGRATIAGAHLYSVDISGGGRSDAVAEAPRSTFSSAALGEFDAAMAKIEALLARNRVEFDDEDGVE